MPADKRFGQHFLKDREVADSIVKYAEIDNTEVVVEIGPGLGILTQRLARVAKETVAIEMDKRLIPILKEKFQESKNVRIIEADALSYNYLTLNTPFKVVSNLPYNISVPLTMHLLKYKSLIPEMVLMYQQEVAKRLCAEPGEKAYGSLSIAVQYLAEISPLLHIGPESFSPPPKVNSTVVKIKLRKQPAAEVKNEAFFFTLVKTLFAHRRKTIKNNLKSLRMPEETLNKAIDKCGIDIKRRGESLSMAEFAAMANHLS